MTYQYISKRDFPELNASTLLEIYVDGITDVEQGFQAIKEPLWKTFGDVIGGNYFDWCRDFQSPETPTQIQFMSMPFAQLQVCGNPPDKKRKDVVLRAVECAISDMTARAMECCHVDGLIVFGKSIWVVAQKGESIIVSLENGWHDPG